MATVRLTPTSLRGLAHPLRVRILGLLREYGPATSTTLAERLGQSTGITSYHLRQLASHGFIVEDEERGTARERWWKAAHSGTSFDSDLADAAPVEAEAFIRAIAATYADVMERWLNEASTLDKPWRDVSVLSDWRLKLTLAEAEQLKQQLFALIEPYRNYTEPDAPEGAEIVQFQVQVMPFIEGER